MIDRKLEYQHLNHDSLPPFFDGESEIIILGSFPSVQSRLDGFYYAYKTNRFFPVLASLFAEDVPLTIEERKEFLKKHHIALFDVIKECDIRGSQDSSIKNVIPNDIEAIISSCHIKAVFTTGKTASSLYRDYIGEDNIYLPSPSAANASMSLGDLSKAYSVILDFISD